MPTLTIESADYQIGEPVQVQGEILNSVASAVFQEPMLGKVIGKAEYHDAAPDYMVQVYFGQNYIEVWAGLEHLSKPETH